MGKEKRRRSEKQNPNKTMSVAQHLSELRKRIYIIIGAFFATFIVSYSAAPMLITNAIGLAENYVFIQTGVTELLGQYILVALISGIVLTAPIIVWQVYSFASPGLTKKEEWVFLAVMLCGLALFVIGAVFCYLIVIPFSLQFFRSINTIDVGGLYSIKEYISYIVSMLVCFGAIFEIPVVSAILTSIGLISPKVMIASRRIVIVACFVIGAVITPPDVASQIMVTVPMLVLYEISILISKVLFRQKKQKQGAKEAAVNAEETENAEESE